MHSSFFDYAEKMTIPIVAVAVHHGHDVRPEVAARLKLDEAQRFREEDPYTGMLAQAAPARFIVHRSRFEVDLNRPRDKAVYLRPEDAWGLDVWSVPRPSFCIRRSLAEYDAFYRTLEHVLTRAVAKFGRVVLFDLHSYNHRRAGPGEPPEDPQHNPEINVGTGTMERSRWTSLVDGFIEDLRAFPYQGRRLDVRENVKFFGGQVCRWTHDRFPSSVCALAVEFKKFFMDEWTGQLDFQQLRDLASALRSTVPGCVRRLESANVHAAVGWSHSVKP